MVPICFNIKKEPETKIRLSPYLLGLRFFLLGIIQKSFRTCRVPAVLPAQWTEGGPRAHGQISKGLAACCQALESPLLSACRQSPVQQCDMSAYRCCCSETYAHPAQERGFGHGIAQHHFVALCQQVFAAHEQAGVGAEAVGGADVPQDEVLGRGCLAHGGV